MASPTPRPVWARHLRRAAGEEVGAPTEEEKRDAIDVLRDAPDFDWFRAGRELNLEAERIFMEASL